MKKVLVLLMICCLVVGISSLARANDAVKISGEVRVEYDNTMSRD